MERSGMHTATPLKKNEKNYTELAKIVTARYSLWKVIGLVAAGGCTILLRPCRAKSCAPFAEQSGRLGAAILHNVII